MRSLTANKQKFYYALYQSKAPVADSDGMATFEYTAKYGTPVAMYANISAARGRANFEEFGINDNYTRLISTTDMSCPISSSSILWIGITPDAYGESGAVKHNYVVTRVAKSLNSITIAIREVDVS